MAKVKIVRKRKGDMEIETTKPEATNFAGEEPGKVAKAPEALDSLLGDAISIEGLEEGKYFEVLGDEVDPTPAGWITNPQGVRIPITTHIPTGSKEQFRKVLITLPGGERKPVWERVAKADS